MTPELWEHERRLWLEGAEAYDELLHPQCVMVFAAPVGVLRGEAIAESLKGAPRWTQADFLEPAFAETQDAVVLAYRAQARREGGDVYAAYCSSTYVREPGGWRMIQHQQTPAD